MLFSHALLFSLLTASTLAIPVPMWGLSGTGMSSSPSTQSPEVSTPDPNDQANGLWFADVSEYPFFTSHPVLNLDGRILNCRICPK